MSLLLRQNGGICTMKNKLTFNESVREAIALALIQLMKTKPFSQITISEIAKLAGVSRSSIYRNFNSKEQVLISYIHDLYNNYFLTEDILHYFPEQADMHRFLLPRFRFIKQNRDFFTVLHKNNLLYYIFEQMEPNLLLLLNGQDSTHSPYYLSMFAGSYAAIIGRWINNDFKESEDEMVEIFSSYPH